MEQGNSSQSSKKQLRQEQLEDDSLEQKFLTDVEQFNRRIKSDDNLFEATMNELLDRQISSITFLELYPITMHYSKLCFSRSQQRLEVFLQRVDEYITIRDKKEVSDVGGSLNEVFNIVREMLRCSADMYGDSFKALALSYELNKQLSKELNDGYNKGFNVKVGTEIHQKMLSIGDEYTKLALKAGLHDALAKMPQNELNLLEKNKKDFEDYQKKHDKETRRSREIEIINIILMHKDKTGREPNYAQIRKQVVMNNEAFSALLQSMVDNGILRMLAVGKEHLYQVINLRAAQPEMIRGELVGETAGVKANTNSENGTEEEGT